jgi:hypothetical protein
LNYYSTVVHCAYGNCLKARKKLLKGTIVQKFKGKILSWEKIPEDEICYVLQINNNRWMIPKSDAKYINHSCNPNCIIDDNLQIITTRPVEMGEELTICYNTVYDGEDPGIWDQRWTFKCQCGALDCQGIVDKYVTQEGKPWIPINHFNLINLHANNLPKCTH